MLKPFLLAGAAVMAAPVLAQTTPVGAPTQTDSQATVPVPATDAATGQPAPATPVDDTVEPGATPAAPAAPAAAVAGQPAPAATAAGTSEAEQIIGREFGAYDKNQDGKLSQAEFDTWMLALKTAGDPTTRADAPATRAWLGAAFAQADADRSRDVTQAELTGFLLQGQS